LKRRITEAEAVVEKRISWERELRALILYVKHKMPWAREEVLTLLRRLDTLSEDVEVNDRWVWTVLDEYAKAQEAKKRAETGPSIGGVHGVVQDQAELSLPSVGEASEGAEPEGPFGAERDAAGEEGQGAVRLTAEGEEPDAGEAPPLPDEEAPQLPPWALEPCPRCGGIPCYDDGLGEWICLSCSSPLRILWRRLHPT